MKLPEWMGTSERFELIVVTSGPPRRSRSVPKQSSNAAKRDQNDEQDSYARSCCLICHVSYL